jgi:hypothetical protein
MISQFALKKAIHIGHFHIAGDSMRFYRNGYRAKDIKALGDVVYFMYVNGELYKIGKAGGANGFCGRAGTYNRGRLGDATNRRIMDIMEDIPADEIQVYALPIPRRIFTETCPLTGEIFEIEVSLHKEYESRYTTMYLEEDSSHDLPFCNQLN